MDVVLICDSVEVGSNGTQNRCNVVLKGVDEDILARVGGTVKDFRKLVNASRAYVVKHQPSPYEPILSKVRPIDGIWS